MFKAALLAAILCGQTSASPERSWHAIANPGPNGDYRVWGYPDPQGIRYFPSEQVEARAALNKPKAPIPTEPSIGAWATNGVSGLSTQAVGTIVTNASKDEFNPNTLTTTEACKPDPPEQEQDPPDGIPLWLVAVLVVGGLSILAGVAVFATFIFIYGILRRRRR